MTSKEPIRISQNSGGMMYRVDYGDGIEQNFPSLQQAMDAARSIADQEGRDIEVNRPQVEDATSDDES